MRILREIRNNRSPKGERFFWICRGRRPRRPAKKPSPGGPLFLPQRGRMSAQLTGEGEKSGSPAIGEASPSSPSSVSTGGCFPRWGKHRIVRQIRGLVRIRRTIPVYSPVYRRAAGGGSPYGVTGALCHAQGTASSTARKAFPAHGEGGAKRRMRSLILLP